MKSIRIGQIFGILLLFGFTFGDAGPCLGFFENITKYIKERKEISAHSRNVSGAVKTLYRERKSIQSLAQSASTLIQAYKGIANKSASIPKLLDIARAITTVISEYSNLAPKTEKLYSGIKPDLEYFATLKDGTDDKLVTVGQKSNQFILKSFSDNRIGKLAGAAGWSRVWSSVTDNPMNLFRWGKLSDEYKMGKTEGTYALKCAQIAFETESYYQAAKNSIQGLLGIRNEINGILNGDLFALLGLGNTVSNIQGAAGSAQVLGDTLGAAVNNMGARFNELNKIQNEYVKVHQNYAQKYGNPAGQNASTSEATSGNSISGNMPGVRDLPGNAGSNAGNAGGAKDLQTAMANYQKAYAAYIKITQDPEASQNERSSAIQNLQSARNRVETLKANANR